MAVHVSAVVPAGKVISVRRTNSSLSTSNVIQLAMLLYLAMIFEMAAKSPCWPTEAIVKT